MILAWQGSRNERGGCGTRIAFGERLLHDAAARRHVLGARALSGNSSSRTLVDTATGAVDDHAADLLGLGGETRMETEELEAGNEA
jgi:hypothetical protein